MRIRARRILFIQFGREPHNGLVAAFSCGPFCLPFYVRPFYSKGYLGVFWSIGGRWWIKFYKLRALDIADLITWRLCWMQILFWLSYWLGSLFS